MCQSLPQAPASVLGQVWETQASALSPSHRCPWPLSQTLSCSLYPSRQCGPLCPPAATPGDHQAFHLTGQTPTHTGRHSKDMQESPQIPEAGVGQAKGLYRSYGSSQALSCPY